MHSSEHIYLQYVKADHDSKLLHVPSCLAGPGSVEVKLGKNRTEADVRRYTDDRDRLEREREEVKNTLATLRKDRKEVKEELSSCQGTAAPPIGHVWKCPCVKSSIFDGVFFLFSRCNCFYILLDSSEIL